MNVGGYIPDGMDEEEKVIWMRMQLKDTQAALVQKSEQLDDLLNKQASVDLQIMVLGTVCELCSRFLGDSIQRVLRKPKYARHGHLAAVAAEAAQLNVTLCDSLGSVGADMAGMCDNYEGDGSPAGSGDEFESSGDEAADAFALAAQAAQAVAQKQVRFCCVRADQQSERSRLQLFCFLPFRAHTF